MQSLEAHIKRLEDELKLERASKTTDSPTSLTPSSHVRIPKEPKFGKSAKPVFNISDGEAAPTPRSSNQDENPPPEEREFATEHVDFSASTPIQKSCNERSTSFFTADDLTPVTTRLERETSSCGSQPSKLNTNKQRATKGFTDSSYFNEMMETVTTSQIDGLLSEKSPPSKRPRTPVLAHKKKATKPKAITKSKSTIPVWIDANQFKGLKIDLTIPTTSKKPPSSTCKIISPKSRPPFISPSATRSGLLFGK